MTLGTLFTSDFLKHGIRNTHDWSALSDAAVNTISEKIGSLLTAAASARSFNEANTEARLVYRARTKTDPAFRPCGFARTLRHCL
ncbi:MAG: hypothetical protein ACKVRO_18860 [Micropepsaceae bacterium]